MRIIELFFEILIYSEKKANKLSGAFNEYVGLDSITKKYPIKINFIFKSKTII